MKFTTALVSTVIAIACVQAAPTDSADLKSRAFGQNGTVNIPNQPN